MCHAEIMLQPAFGRASFFMSDNDHRLIPEGRQSTDQRVVIAIDAVAAEFLKIIKQLCQIITEVRPFRVSGDLGLPPCR